MQVVAGCFEHLGPEDGARARLRQVDLSVRVPTKMLPHLLFEDPDLPADGSDHRYQGPDSGSVHRDHDCGLAQLRARQRRDDGIRLVRDVASITHVVMVDPQPSHPSRTAALRVMSKMPVGVNAWLRERRLPVPGFDFQFKGVRRSHGNANSICLVNRILHCHRSHTLPRQESAGHRLANWAWPSHRTHSICARNPSAAWRRIGRSSSVPAETAISCRLPS